ncbi:MAG: MFS transporter, partial [Nitrospiraceae bacterium]|nr:MFS transporter [Nitrospiraceae bacterium]
MATSTAVNEGGVTRRGELGFWALVGTMFQGAFNDNLFQFLVIYFLVGLYASNLVGAAAEAKTAWITSIATIVFSLPSILLPGLFGALSDRYSKKRVTVWSKYLEVGVMLLGAVAFFMGSPLALWCLLFLMASQSAFFSPSKYGILPEILPESRLSWANGVLALGTMVAILAGVGAAGPIYDKLGEDTYWAGFLLAGLSCLGVAMAYGITRPAVANPGRKINANPWMGVRGYFKDICANRVLLIAVVGYVYFWFVGTFLRNNLISFGSATLGMTATQVSIMQAWLILGIGLGSLAAGYLSRERIELGIVPVALLGLAGCCVALYFEQPSRLVLHCLLGLMGFFGGAFNVPLQASIQYLSPKESKGGTIAAINMLTFVGMLLAGALLLMLSAAGVTPYQIFLLTAVLSLLVLVYLIWKLPYFLIRCILWFLTNTLYRIKVYGAENVPTKGGALLVANHTSFADPGVVTNALDRPVSFLGFRSYVESWWMRRFLWALDVIPIAASDGPGALAKSLSQARDEVLAGRLVCLFPEGGITRTGQLLSFQKGYQRVVRGTDAPIIPVYLDGLWGSLLSFSDGRFFKKWPKRIPYPIRVEFGEPMPNTSTPRQLRMAVQDLSERAWSARRPKPALLHRGFFKMARRHPKMLTVADARSGALPAYRTMAGTVILARKLKQLLGSEKMVGIMVPPSVGGTLTNIALQVMGRVPVNLNYTATNSTLEGCAKRCEMTHCITAKAFLDRVPVDVPAEPIYLEDVMATVTKADRIVGLLLGLFCPVRLLERLLGSPPGRTSEDLATVIFSSGSEGEPKGVMLTQRNILINIDAASQVFPYKRGDVMMGFLPFFHSYGFTGTLWAPLITGMSAVFHPSPLEPQAIGKLIKKYKARFFTATPTFLQNFIRRCTTEQMKSLDFVICGAERLPNRVREAYIEKFGVEPLEGYGATECSPIIAANIPDFKLPHHNIIM